MDGTEIQNETSDASTQTHTETDDSKASDTFLTVNFFVDKGYEINRII